MKIFAYERFQTSYRHLPSVIQHKLDKQLALLADHFRHPSLQVKRVKGTRGIWEARVDLHYRMTFEIVDHAVYLRVVGNHDDVLRNPSSL